MGKSKASAKEEQRRKEAEKVLEKNLPISWIKQPINLTFLRGDIDRLQLIVITMTMDKLQNRVNKWLSMSDSDKKLQPSLFTDDEMRQGMEPVKIQLNEYGIQRSHYDRIDKATDVLLAMHVDIIENGDKVKRNLFSEVRIPTYETLAGEKRKRSYIEFKVNPDAMRTYYDMSRYNRYIKETVLNCKGKFTARIYMCITAYKFQYQKKWKVKYSDLRIMLGVDEQDGKNVIKKKYPIYTDFRKRVLNDSMSELDELQEQNKVDCYFTFDEIFKDGVRRGDPEYIVFNILLTELGKQDQLNHYCSGEINDVLDSIGFPPAEKIAILKHAIHIDRDVFLTKLREIERIVTSKRDTINNPLAYAQSIIKSFVMQYETIHDDVEDAVVETTNEEIETEQQGAIDQKLKNLWDRFKNSMTERVGESVVNTWVDPLAPVSFTDGKLQIHSPSYFICETLEGDKHADHFFTSLREVFGKDVELYWV